MKKKVIPQHYPLWVRERNLIEEKTSYDYSPIIGWMRHEDGWLHPVVVGVNGASYYYPSPFVVSWSITDAK